MTKQRIVVFLLAGAAIASAAYVGTYGFLPKGASTISLLHAAATFDQCSREAPRTDAGGFWLPTARQVREAEPFLPALGRQIPADYHNRPGPDDVFVHQYIGFTRGGRRLIYVNVSADDWRPQDMRGMQDWIGHYAEALLPEKPLNTCDGGAFFWGVVYDPGTRQFEAPVFNGR